MPTHAYLNLALELCAPAGSGLNSNQQNVANALTNFFNSNRRHSGGLRRADAGGLTQASGETATGSQQTTFDAMNLFMGLLTDPFIDGRGDAPALAAARPVCRRRLRLCAQASRAAERDAYRDVHQGAAGRALRAALERVGGGLWRFADHRRQCRARIEQYHEQRRRHRGRRRLSVLAEHARRLCAGRRRHQFQRRQWRHRPFRPVPGRRLRSPHGRAGLYLRPRWPMAGRTSPPTAP